MGEPGYRRSPPLFQSMLLDRLQAFTRLEAAGGIVLLVNAVMAFVLANSPWRDQFLSLWAAPIRFEAGDLHLDTSLRAVIDEGLMAIFFLLVGLEIKRELIEGELRTFRKALLPAIGAAGGVVLPASIFLALNHGGPGERGWAIPIATDIAFSIGCVVLLGKRVPRGLLVFLTALAIFDDIVGIGVIAIFYGHGIRPAGLILVAVTAGAVFGIARLGADGALVYALGGMAMWLAFRWTGLNGTLAGVLLGLLVPAVSRRPAREVLEELNRRSATALQSDARVESGELLSLRDSLADGVPPLQRFEHALHPWVVFGILPLFALANSGVSLEGLSLRSLGPVFFGIALGLFVGKQLGVFLFTWGAVKAGFARAPEGSTWGKVHGIATVAGIGFTVSLFIANLAFGEDPLLLSEARLGILVGSLASGVVGTLVLRANSRAPPRIAPSAA